MIRAACTGPGPRAIPPRRARASPAARDPDFDAPGAAQAALLRASAPASELRADGPPSRRISVPWRLARPGGQSSRSPALPCRARHAVARARACARGTRRHPTAACARRRAACATMARATRAGGDRRRLAMRRLDAALSDAAHAAGARWSLAVHGPRTHGSRRATGPRGPPAPIVTGWHRSSTARRGNALDLVDERPPREVAPGRRAHRGSRARSADGVALALPRARRGVPPPRCATVTSIVLSWPMVDSFEAMASVSPWSAPRGRFLIADRNRIGRFFS